MRKILIISAALLAWTSTGFAAELMVKIPVDEYRETKKEIDSLKEQVRMLEKRISGGEGAAAPAAAEEAPAPAAAAAVDDRDIQKINRDISEIYDTLDEVETSALLDKINLGAEARIRMDNYRVKNYQPIFVDMNPMSGTFGTWYGMSPPLANAFPYVVDEKNDGNWSSRFRLNMEADVSKTVKFSARLALQKNWADSMGVFFSTDNNRAHVNDGDTDLKVDRFYIDWTPRFFTPVTVSFGRLPTSDGPPLEYKENRQRQSIYPALIFDGEPDGIVVTFGLERYLKLRNSGLRYFYAMATQFDADNLSMNYMDSVWMDSYKDNRVSALFFETELPGLRDSLLVLSYVPAQEILMQSPFDPTGTDSADNLGDITLYGVHLQVPDLFRSGLDLFASFGNNRNKPNGHTINYAGSYFGLFSGVPLGFPGALAQDAAPTQETDGWAWSTGFRYEIPVRVLNRPKIGFEYNRGNKYWFSYTPGPSELYNKAATRGEAYDVYYIQPLNKEMFLRTGYTMIEYEATGSGMPFGYPAEYKNDMGYTENPEFHNFYVTLDCRF